MSLFALIAFGLACVALYYACPARARWALLLFVSYAFYAYCSLSAVPYLLLTTATTWAGALYIARAGERGKREIEARRAGLDAAGRKQIKAAARARQRRMLAAVLAFNFALLGVFKYLNPLLGALGRPKLSLLLPLGISFYTFQSVGYLIDVYNGKLAPERNPARYALFVSFFPQLVQGPIARYGQLAPELFTPHRFELSGVERGALLMLWGFFKKRVVADWALVPVEAAFSGHARYGGAAIALGVLFYSLQQYADFSGGIDLVTGMAEMMGIRLAPNFKRPYFAVSLGDFWRRWHISLGAWMRDYVFYPFAVTKPMQRLSKAAKGRFGAGLSRALPAALGNLLVFFLVGVWHGATANYVLWGLYNGVILASSALLEGRYRRFGERHASLVASPGFHVFRVLRTFLIVNIGWFFDRSATAADAFSMLGKLIFSPRFSEVAGGVPVSFGLTEGDVFVLAVSTLIIFCVSLLQERGVRVRDSLMRLPLPARWALLIPFTLFILATFKLNGGPSGGFLYAVF